MQVYSNREPGIHRRSWEKILPRDLEERSHTLQEMAKVRGDTVSLTELQSLHRSAEQGGTRASRSNRSLAAVGAGVAGAVAGYLSFGWAGAAGLGLASLFVTSEALLLSSKVSHEGKLQSYVDNLLERYSENAAPAAPTSSVEPWKSLQADGYLAAGPVKGPLPDTHKHALSRTLDDFQQHGITFYDPRRVKLPFTPSYNELKPKDVLARTAAGSEFSKPFYLADAALENQLMVPIHNLGDLQAAAALHLPGHSEEPATDALRSLVKAGFTPVTREHYSYDENDWEYQDYYTPRPTSPLAVYRRVEGAPGVAGLVPPGATANSYDYVQPESHDDLLALDYVAGSGQDRGTRDPESLEGVTEMFRGGYRFKGLGGDRGFYSRHADLEPYDVYKMVRERPGEMLWYAREQGGTFPIVRGQLADAKEIERRERLVSGPVARESNRLEQQGIRVDRLNWAWQAVESPQGEVGVRFLSRVMEAHHKTRPEVQWSDLFETSQAQLKELETRGATQADLHRLVSVMDLVLEFVPPELTGVSLDLVRNPVGQESLEDRATVLVGVQMDAPEGKLPITSPEKLEQRYRDEAARVFTGGDTQRMDEIKAFLDQKRRERMIGDLVGTGDDGKTVEDEEDYVIVGDVVVNKG